MNLAPIVLFVYNRSWHTKQTIEALQQNELAGESELFIYSDAPKTAKVKESVSEVRALVNNITGFKKITVIEREKNWGLAASIIDGVTTLIDRYGKIIVLEDDLVTSPFFLKYMNSSLDFYKNEENIYSITGFSFSSEFMKFPKHFDDDVYLNIRPMSWSWATWKKEWDGIDWEIEDFNEFISSKKLVKKFNMGGRDLTRMLNMQIDGQLDSWYIRWTYNAFKKGKLTVYPRMSLVNNVGHDNTGVHCGIDPRNIYSHSELNSNINIKLVRDITLNSYIVDNFNKAFNPPLSTIIKRHIKNILKHAKTS